MAQAQDDCAIIRGPSFLVNPVARYLLFNPDSDDRAATAPSPLSVSALGRQIGAAAPLAVVELALALKQPLIVLATDPRHADQLEAEIRWFAGPDLPVAHFVEWETLPYDSFFPTPGHRIAATSGPGYAWENEKRHRHCVQSVSAAAITSR